jgi:ribokinase
MSRNGIAILGVFVADLTFRAGKLPGIGETIKGSGFAIGPGGKGSNQAVAAARAGASVTFISRLGTDTFGELALKTWKAEGIEPRVTQTATPTGAAFIYVHETRGDNAIIIVPGAAADLCPADVEAAADTIRASRVFVTQLEQPAEAARRGLEIARSAGSITVFNPAPAIEFDTAVFALSDYVVPNESEAEALTGIAVEADLDAARRAGDALLAEGAGTALITLGERGALFHAKDRSIHIAPFAAGKVVETTGAGDAFVGGFAAALAGGADPLVAARFGSAAAGISVTRTGAAPAMPHRAEIEALLREGSRS